MNKEVTKRHSFILRLWCEGESQEWKGWVQHVNSGESIRVQTTAELLAFIDRHKTHKDLQALKELVTEEKVKKTGLR
jgi:hypothetical protein